MTSQTIQPNSPKKVYIAGNPYLNDDNISHAIARILSLEHDIKTIPLLSPDDILLINEEDITIIDVVKGITEPIHITDASTLKTRHLMSLHDFDFGYFLNMMNELGIGKRLNIIGIPQNGDITAISGQVKEWI